MWETLPKWFWVIYYLFLLTTLGTAFFTLGIRKIKSLSFILSGLSVIAILFTLIIPIISLIASIGRKEGMNEFEHLVSQLQQGAAWSIFVTIGYLFLLFWWLIFLFNIMGGNIFALKKNNKVG
ncbi:hypothetical protein LC087_00465 [Bacillus carboniphilus]|uniref:Uncharacterized protein n=1 Tax=Bacillus carboniphilus TaxID=86663 RepID=A0ABY9JTM4_9BACI|nr:hypothetical protein [Bacillus carboniphilus]WLR42757.1 hypothetical protein LC087_00465 [Bacillus carboniphilus]